MNSEEKPTKSKIAEREEEILKFWKDNQIFEKSLTKPSPKGEFVFYDGPPFATGLPHYGHLLASTIKDVIPRYKTMQGYHVPRRWGWDCHGLPIETIVEKELGFKHKKDIKEYGIDKFNERCRGQVLMYAHEWEKIIPRIGRFVDIENPYRTMDMPFMESVWWVFKQLYDKGLVYEDYRSMHICPRCETTLSQQEVAEAYKDVKDISVTVKFHLRPNQKFASGKYETKDSAYILAWTTTPWTLPGNVALAVGEDIKYTALRISVAPELYIVASNAVEKIFKDKEIEIVHSDLSGRDLVGLEYEPLFDYYYKDETLKNRENGWKVYAADFITAESGTGIAHEAPAFGADDWELLKKENLPFVQHVNMDGTMKREVEDFAGMEVKPKSDDDKIRLGTDIAVIRYLQEHGNFFSKENIVHTYPHCWRCDTPLLNYATSSWFVSVTKIKPELLENAEEINWSPGHIKEGRFGKWLEGARDWSVSRQRFWASAIPLWVCESCKKQCVFGSVSELEEASGTKVEDLHKHIVDKITFKCECGGDMHRIPDVLDTWFDSGSMPYGQVHYPFENKEKFEKSFPAEFIGEGLDQTRAWFYYLHVLAVALFRKNAFKNAIVNGIVAAEDGQKMSKKLKNYPDPSYAIDKYGADALRFYFLSSPVVRAEDLSFSEKGLDDVHKKIILRLENVLSFYEMYAGVETIERNNNSENILDKWILSRLFQMREGVTSGLDKYELDRASRPILDFVDDLSVWYLRRSRDRFKQDENIADKKDSLGTMNFILFELSKIMAPFTPFIADYIYEKVKSSDDLLSVHLAEWPPEGKIEEEVLKKMEEVRRVVSLSLEKRNAAGVKVRQPLQKLTVKSGELREMQEYLDLIKGEVNVKEIEFDQNIADEVMLDTELTPELKIEGDVREFIRAIQDLRKEKGLTPKDTVELVVETDKAGKEFLNSALEQIKKPTNLSGIVFRENDGKQIVNGELKFKIQLG